MVVVCGKICSKIFCEMCGKIEKLLDWNKNWCGSIYGPRDYDSGDKKTKSALKKHMDRGKYKPQSMTPSFLCSKCGQLAKIMDDM